MSCVVYLANGDKVRVPKMSVTQVSAIMHREPFLIITNQYSGQANQVINVNYIVRVADR